MNTVLRIIAILLLFSISVHLYFLHNDMKLLNKSIKEPITIKFEKENNSFYTPW